MYSNQRNNYIPEPFGIRDIRITNVVISLPTLVDKLYAKEIDIYNSEHCIDYWWGKEKMSRLIESILLKIPLPIFYFDVSYPSKWISIDGVQKLYAINQFMDNELELTNMEILKHLEGMNYYKLNNSYKRILYDTQIITYQVEAQTPIGLRELIFRKIRDMNAN